MKIVVAISLIVVGFLSFLFPVEAPTSNLAVHVVENSNVAFPSQLSEFSEAELDVLPVVLKYADEFKICSALVLAIIQQESEFRNGIVGDKGRSIGLMQIQHVAAQDAGYAGIESQWRKEAINAEINIEFGVRYLALQQKRYSSSPVYVTAIENIISSYNAGQPTLKNEWYIRQVLLGRSDRGYFFYLSQLGTKHMTQSNNIPPQEEEIEFLRTTPPASTSASVAVIRNGPAVIRNGSRKSSSMVAITIDDGWDPKLVAEALLILREEGVKCTLFPTGVALRFSSLWKSALADGNELGNHSYFHKPISSLTEEEIEEEIRGWEKAAGGYKTMWFRPPKMSGFSNARDTEKYSKIVEKLGYLVVLWSIDTYYGIYKEQGLKVDPAIVTEYVLDKVTAGDIILLHFIRPDVEALRGIIRGIRAKGLEPVTLTTLLILSK